MTVILLLGVILAIVLVYEGKITPRYEREIARLKTEISHMQVEHEEALLYALGYEAQLGAIRSYLEEEGLT